MEYTLPKEGSMPKQQQTYTKEFKLEVVQLVKSSGKLMSQIARELGISDSALYHWSKQLADQGEQAFPVSGHQTVRGGRSSADSTGSWKSPGRSAAF
jgi:transposase